VTARALVGTAMLAGALALAPPDAGAHHVGSWTPRDNEVSANFKQLKFAIQARKWPVALDLFEAGAVRKEMQAQAARFPPGIEAATRAALQAGDGAAAEQALAVVFAALARDLALDADTRLGDVSQPIAVRAATGAKFLEAIWRYYSLVDFVVSQRHPKAALTVRLAVDEAEVHLKGPATPSSSSTKSAESRPRPEPPSTAAPPAGPAPDRARAPLQRIAQALGDVVQAFPAQAPSSSTRRQS
jgi:hypothetical protein